VGNYIKIIWVQAIIISIRTPEYMMIAYYRYQNESSMILFLNFLNGCALLLTQTSHLQKSSRVARMVTIT